MTIWRFDDINVDGGSADIFSAKSMNPLGVKAADILLKNVISNWESSATIKWYPLANCAFLISNWTISISKADNLFWSTLTGLFESIE